MPVSTRRPAGNPRYVPADIIDLIWRSSVGYDGATITFDWNNRLYRFRYVPDIYARIWLYRAGRPYTPDLESYILLHRPGTVTIAEIEHDLYQPG